MTTELWTSHITPELHEPTYAAPNLTSDVGLLSFEETEPMKYELSDMREKFPRFSDIINRFLKWYDTTNEPNPIKALTIPMTYFGQDSLRSGVAESVLAIFLPDELDQCGAQFAACSADITTLDPLDLLENEMYMHWCIKTDSTTYLSLLVAAVYFMNILKEAHIDDWGAYEEECMDEENIPKLWIPVMFIGRKFAYISGVKVNKHQAMTVYFGSTASRPIRLASREEIEYGLHKMKQAGNPRPWAKGYWSEREGHSLIQARTFGISEDFSCCSD